MSGHTCTLAGPLTVWANRVLAGTGLDAHSAVEGCQAQDPAPGTVVLAAVRDGWSATDPEAAS